MFYLFNVCVYGNQYSTICTSLYWLNLWCYILLMLMQLEYFSECQNPCNTYHYYQLKMNMTKKNLNCNARHDFTLISYMYQHRFRATFNSAVSIGNNFPKSSFSPLYYQEIDLKMLTLSYNKNKH